MTDILPAALVTLALILNAVTAKRQGGIVFWRCGRIGGSFYVSKAAPVKPAR